jgi:hypothetical protein
MDEGDLRCEFTCALQAGDCCIVPAHRGKGDAAVGVCGNRCRIKQQ